ncbi:hypothetical protein NMG60_11026050, partial [Bertholletia excelsa]
KSTDSDATSLAASSPGRSPGRRPAYFVQSPSRDSHEDGEKTTNSFHSTPAALSPMASPGHHSGRSSSTRFSGSGGSRRHQHRKSTAVGNHFDAIEEEGLLGGDAGSGGLPRRCYFPVFVLGFVILFSFFSLVLWGASRNQKPVVTMKSISFDEFLIQAGNDFSGVATEMVTMNSTVKLVFRNTGTFFGVHVTSTPLDLSFSQLTVATGTMKKFYQSRKSQRMVTVVMQGSHVPLYGGGASLTSIDGKPTAPVPLKLSFALRSRAYVLGRLVKPKFYKKVQCSTVFDPQKMNVAVSLKTSCTYQ